MQTSLDELVQPAKPKINVTSTHGAHKLHIGANARTPRDVHGPRVQSHGVKDRTRGASGTPNLLLLLLALLAACSPAEVASARTRTKPPNANLKVSRPRRRLGKEWDLPQPRAARAPPPVDPVRALTASATSDDFSPSILLNSVLIDTARNTAAQVLLRPGSEEDGTPARRVAAATRFSIPGYATSAMTSPADTSDGEHRRLMMAVAAAEHDAAAWLVQLDPACLAPGASAPAGSNPFSAVRAAIASANATVLSYTPESAFLVSVPDRAQPGQSGSRAAVLHALASMPCVGWLGPWQPVYKSIFLQSPSITTNLETRSSPAFNDEKDNDGGNREFVLDYNTYVHRLLSAVEPISADGAGLARIALSIVPTTQDAATQLWSDISAAIISQYAEAAACPAQRCYLSVTAATAELLYITAFPCNSRANTTSSATTSTGRGSATSNTNIGGGSASSSACSIPKDVIQLSHTVPTVLWVEVLSLAELRNAFARDQTQSGGALDNYYLREYGSCAQCVPPVNSLPDIWSSDSLSWARATSSSNPQSRLPSGTSATSTSTKSSACDPDGPCNNPACGFDFANCFQSFGASIIAAAGLDGSGQLVHISDSGLDYRRSPFFIDGRQQLVPSKTGNIGDSGDRKVASYWAFMDSFDYASGHGTHCAGSVAGAVTSSLDPTRQLQQFNGMAPSTRIHFTDIGCNVVSCACPAVAPCNSSCPNGYCDVNNQSTITPDDLTLLFTSAYVAGCRISSNSWGGSSPIYDTRASTLDSYVFSIQDMLILFAASNDGAEGVPVSYASLGRQPTAKNVLSVGATLSDYNSYDFVYNDWSSGIMCAAAGECSSTCLSTFLCGFPPAMLLTSSQLCWGFVNMTVLVGQSTIQPVLSLFKETCEFAPIFCCSTCSPLSVYEEAQQFGSDSANCIAAMMQQMFAAHSRASFSSLGPTLDGRIKPDVVAPGYFITSARAQPPAPLLSEIYDCSRVTNSSECGSSRTSELDHLLQHSQSIIQYVQPKLGTSMATPITAGNAVLVRQYFIDGFFPTGAPSAADGFSPSAALMKAVLVAGAMPLAFAQHPAWYFRWATTRDISQEYVNAGFGSVNLIRSLSFASLGTSQRSLGQVQTMALPGYTFVESASGSNPPRTASEPSVEHGNTMQFCVDTYTTLRAESLSVNLPLTISLVWTDPPASPAALYVLVNNLDLEIVTPQAMLVRGNNDPSLDQSQQRADDRNNVERVLFHNPVYTLDENQVPVSAPYNIIVRGTLVPQGPQKFSLVVSGPGVTLTGRGCGPVPAPNAANPAPDPNIAQIELLQVQRTGLTATVALLGFVTLIGATFAVWRCWHGASATSSTPAYSSLRSPLGPGSPKSPKWFQREFIWRSSAQGDGNAQPEAAHAAAAVVDRQFNPFDNQ